MLWARLLAYVTGTVNQELLLRNEYLAAENRILRCVWRIVISPMKVTLSHSVAGLARLELSLISKVFAPDNIFGSDRRVLVLQDHSKHPRVARSGTTRILFRASGSPCFQVDHGTTRIESICQCLSKLGQRILKYL
jgi:hypothetical protein